ncbi:PSD1 and planctomycete cytochrome C domain-containing protein [Rubripirellula reticaptiva]|uniref:Planctomycete cytochrome C n=1 Tax=Rubripirellula reticaptiva TaxID=2528013 RepID=A0A5C6F631_9BACT|nr:PSD1 and planctomycete cytochrome C domain-containing protein [Rubripirellula reticaptiva]TWU57153.1 Planctomycete cytochrome C [Rubripirellula reticaptiva]
MSHRRSAAACLLAIITCASMYADGLTPREEFFENQVRPLLVEKCMECHSEKLQESDLRLDSRELILQGGISGPAAIARNIEDSLIVKVISGDENFERMPPDEPLDNDEINILKKWVRLGMPWTSVESFAETESGDQIPLGDQVAIGKAALRHWAFQPIAKVSPPGDSNGLNTNPIDAFITARLKTENLKPNSPAERTVLARRMYFDLIGLPPTHEQLDALEHDQRADKEVLDELATTLLSSEHHGERWARYWLDLARYGDTRDWQAQAELRYPYAYTYRDYVIDSLNSDKPYDDFVRQQIAADSYTDDPSSPDLAGLGLLTVGPQFRNNKLEQIADKIDVVCRGLMGITVSCARCHDHKYDPIPTEDFYSLYGVFASTQVPDSFPVIPGKNIPPKIEAEFRDQLSVKQAELEDYKQGLKRTAEAALKKDFAIYMDGFDIMTIQKKSDIRGTVSKLKVVETAMTPLNNKLARTLTDKSLSDDSVLGPWFDGLSVSDKDFLAKRDTLIANWTSNQNLNPRIAAALKQSPPKSRTDLVVIYRDVFDSVINAWVKESRTKAKSNAKLDDADTAIRKVLFGPTGWLDLDVDQVVAASRLLGKGRKDLGDREKAITEVEATHPGAPPKAMTLVDLEKPITPFVMLRGEPNRRGDRVPRQFLRLIAGDQRKPFKDGSGRRELAEAIVAPDNPLTARVAVNRIWSRYFGTGLAMSLDDFGLRSDPPSHPELLDWLAREFMQNDWSMKWLHHTIVTSDTYRQSSAVHDDGLLADPSNRMLWRQNRRRLDFEAMRDSMLAVAGSLDLTLGGRSVKLSEVPYSNRRSVYAYVDRIELDPMLRTFDFASPTASAASRAETTIPQQALFAMNHPFVAQLCRKISGDLRHRDAANDTSRDIAAVYRRVLGREPSPEEASASSQFVRMANDVTSGDATSSGSNTSTWRYGYGPLDADTFTPLPHWTGQVYQTSEEFPDPQFKHLRLTMAGGHPGINEEFCAVRRWIAPGEGVVRITGTLKHAREGSDGIIAMIRSTDVTETFKVQQSSKETKVGRLAVKRGDAIDFVVGPGATTRADSFAWDATVEGIDGELKKQRWNSVNGFQSPPPPPLDPLAQLAQALMLTNEFLYLD